MTKLNLYSAKGTKKPAITYPKKLEEKVNLALLAQAIRVYENSQHFGLSKTLSRGEVTASKRKIYRQKGTGRARHGALSAPIFVGGGKAHGPKGVKRALGMPKKMKKKALYISLTLKAKEGKLLVVESIAGLKKTKDAANLIDKIALKEKSFKSNSRFTFALSTKNKESGMALRNIPNVTVTRFADLNAHIVHFGGVLIIDKDALNEKSDEKNKLAKNSKQ